MLFDQDPSSSSLMWWMTRCASRQLPTEAWEESLCQEWAQHPPPAQWPPLPRPTCRRQKMCSMHRPLGNRSSDTSLRLFSWSAPGLLTMPSRLPSLVESASSILVDGILHTSNFLFVVNTGMLLAEQKGFLPFLRQYVYWRNARQDEHSSRQHSSVCWDNLIAAPLCAKDSLFWIAWLSRALAQTGAA